MNSPVTVSSDTAQGVRAYTLGDLPGDGIGPEVAAEARRCLAAAADRFGFRVDWVDYDLGADRYVRTGEILPDSVLADIRQTDAVLLGAVGRPDVTPGILERGLLLRLRAELDLYVNLRPVIRYPGVTGALAGDPPLDLVIVRENTEGAYCGAGGGAHRGRAAEVATEVSITTRSGVQRCVRYAVELARKRSGRLTLVHKTNVLTFAGRIWQEVAEEEAQAAGIAVDYAHVDAACVHLVADPGRFDVIVTENLFGDILSDLGGALAGGLGYAASANLNPERTGPSLFEPVHGSAPDIAGSGQANPVAAILSAGLLCAHLGEHDAARAIQEAVRIGAGRLAGKATRTVGEELAALVADPSDWRDAGLPPAANPDIPGPSGDGRLGDQEPMVPSRGER